MASRSERAALDFVEAGYRLEASGEEWLRALVEAAEPAFDDGVGVAGFTFHVGAGGGVSITSPMVSVGDFPAAMLTAVPQTVSSLRGEETTMSLECGFDTASEGHARHGLDLGHSSSYQWLRAVGGRDLLGLKMADPTGRGIAIGSALTRKRTIPGRQRRSWLRAATHVLAAMRLRECTLGNEEALIEPGGRVVHAPGVPRSAREALRDAAVAIDRARTRAGRRDPDQTLEAWRGLVRGRWSLVDRFERDGRRFFVARPNTPIVGGAKALSDRERQILAYAALGYSNKLIAYALGLAPSTVSSHLRSGMRALGVRDVAGLAAVLRAVARSDDEPTSPDHARA